MKKKLLVAGSVSILLVMTFFVKTKEKPQQDSIKHSRINHYIKDAVNLYSQLQKGVQNSGRAKTLSSNGKHGLVGLDPWGKPYEYFIKHDTIKSQLTVTLWSKGSDLKSKLKPINIINNEGLSKKDDDFIISQKLKI